MTSTSGRLIAFEGIDGCGKSTQARLLADRLGALLTFEPGGTALGSSLRSLLLDRDQPKVDQRAEALLMAADRAQHVADVVQPALDRGQWVVTDRFSASTLAYQGYGRGLDLADLGRLVQWATGGLTPDVSVLIDVEPSVGLARRAGTAGDRMESERDGFGERVVDGYRCLAEQDPSGWLVIDGRGTVETVAGLVWAGVQDRLGGSK